MFTCKYCDREFSSMMVLGMHTCKPNTPCKLCGLPIYLADGLATHTCTGSKEPDTRYTCDNCDWVSPVTASHQCPNNRRKGQGYNPAKVEPTAHVNPNIQPDLTGMGRRELELNYEGALETITELTARVQQHDITLEDWRKLVARNSQLHDEADAAKATVLMLQERESKVDYAAVQTMIRDLRDTREMLEAARAQIKKWENEAPETKLHLELIDLRKAAKNRNDIHENQYSVLKENLIELQDAYEKREAERVVLVSELSQKKIACLTFLEDARVLRDERNEARAELAATKMKLEGEWSQLTMLEAKSQLTMLEAKLKNMKVTRLTSDGEPVYALSGDVTQAKLLEIGPELQALKAPKESTDDFGMTTDGVYAELGRVSVERNDAIATCSKLRAERDEAYSVRNDLSIECAELRNQVAAFNRGLHLPGWTCVTCGVFIMVKRKK